MENVFVQWGIWSVTAAVLVASLLWLNLILLVRPTLESRVRNQRRWLMLAVTIVVVVVLILRLPVPDQTIGALLQVLGLAVTALITLSSTTIAANMMAGLMLGRVGAFKPGDFIRVFGPGGETFGRVTARGLFHVEIQSEERDLMTVPNSFMIAHPVRTVRQDGTIVTCELSLGYDVPHSKIETLLAKAVEKAGLTDAYVQIRELGDFSVTYRAAGFLSDVKSLLTARSRLRAAILDTLHGAGVEIVSPTFMNQRRVEEPVIAERSRKDPMAKSAFESMIFDKAEDAERVERVREAL
ncbi:MAG: mechanosensitive ion channel family protein, partial [Planctomycetota bacterium]